MCTIGSVVLVIEINVLPSMKTRTYFYIFFLVFVGSVLIFGHFNYAMLRIFLKVYW